MRRSILLVSVLLATGCGDPTGSSNGIQEDLFDENTLGRYTGYSDDGLAWSIGDDKLLGDGRAIQSVLIRDAEPFQDGWVETETDHADDGGLILRFQDNLNYYLLAIRDDSSPWPRETENLKIYKRVDGIYQTLWEADITWTRGDRRIIRFEAEGSVLRVFVDEILIGSVTGGTRFEEGGFGLRHYGASSGWRVSYDSFRWQRE